MGSQGTGAQGTAEVGQELEAAQLDGAVSFRDSGVRHGLLPRAASTLLSHCLVPGSFTPGQAPKAQGLVLFEPGAVMACLPKGLFPYERVITGLVLAGGTEVW